MDVVVVWILHLSQDLGHSHNHTYHFVAPWGHTHCPSTKRINRRTLVHRWNVITGEPLDLAVIFLTVLWSTFDKQGSLILCQSVMEPTFDTWPSETIAVSHWHSMNCLNSALVDQRWVYGHWFDYDLMDGSFSSDTFTIWHQNLTRTVDSLGSDD